MILTTTIYDDSDMPIDITGEYSPPCRGRRNHYGVQMEPDEDADIVVLDAVDSSGDSITLTKHQETQAIDLLWVEISQSA